MNYLISFLLLSILSYFGLVYLIEKQDSDIKELTSEVHRTETPLSQLAELPTEVLGTFELDVKSSKNWLKSQKNLDSETAEIFTELQTEQKEMIFDGEVIWFSGQGKPAQTKASEITDAFVKIIFDSPDDTAQKATGASLQWDAKGGIWYNAYPKGSKTLYRARYIKTGK